MSRNPINLTIRFGLEVAALIGIGYWGWHQSSGALGYLLALVLPLVAAIAVGIFRVPNDTSASGRAPVAVPGIARLILELAFFAFAVWALFRLGRMATAAILGILVILHYLASYDRIAWLLRQ